MLYRLVVILLLAADLLCLLRLTNRSAGLDIDLMNRSLCEVEDDLTLIPKTRRNMVTSNAIHSHTAPPVAWNPRGICLHNPKF